MIKDIKTQFYNILTNDLGYTVMDNPYEQESQKFPYLLMRLGNTTRDVYKNCFQYTFKFTIDIFSDYNGEAEILEMEQAIFEAAQNLYENENITYVRESSFRIIDDKSTGVTRKHGILTYTIVSSGGYINE